MYVQTNYSPNAWMNACLNEWMTKCLMSECPGGGRVYAEGECSYQPNIRKKGDTVCPRSLDPLIKYV